ncbi:MAG: LicD family protein, partial [Eubacterium sp.]|nr:LicD family protein [Eubacterium sp.]
DKIRDKKVLDTKFSAEIKQLEKKMGVSADRISDAPWFIRILAMMDEYTARFSADDCEYISIPAYYDRSHNMKFSKRIYEHYIDVRFEDETIRVPIGYDWILRILYGNYMRPYMAPGAHDYPFYLAMDRDAKTASGYGLLSYEYDAGKINDIKKTAKSADKKDAKERAVGSVLLLEEANESMKELFYAEKDDNQDLLALIGQCQELAIEIGNDIEKNTVNPTDFVTVLEGYCEYLYSQYTILSQAGNNSIVFDDIYDKLVVFSNEMKSESEKLISKKEIVFLVGRAKDWDSLHDLWTEAENDKRYNVTVLSIPMYYKDFDGKILKDEKIEDEVRYPEEVKFSDYETYDFELNHPEIVVYQYPYDEYSDVMSVHPYFYAQNIAKFTDTMVLDSPYELDRNKVLNGPSMYTVGTFLKNPGGCLADVIIARSEQEKQAFEMILTDFAPDRAEKIKIIVNEKNKLCDLKVKDKEKDSKKVLLFTMNASMLYVFGEKAINKAKKVFDIFEKYSDKMEVIWYPDPYANQILQHDEILKKQYDDLVEKYRDKLNLWEGGIETEGHLARKCDGVYGSGCVLMSECRKAGKAVLFEDPCVDISEFEPTGRILTGNEGVTEEGIHPGQWGVEEFVVALLNKDEEARDDVACEEANFGVFQRIFS